MSDNKLNILITARINTNDTHDIENDIAIIAEKLKGKLKIDLGVQSQMNGLSGLGTVLDQIAKKAAAINFQQSTNEINKFAKEIENVDKQLKKLESDKKGLIASERKAFNEADKESVFAKMAKDKPRLPQKGEIGYDQLQGKENKHLRNQYFSKDSGQKIDEYSQQLGYQYADDFIQQIKAGRPKFDPKDVSTSDLDHEIKLLQNYKQHLEDAKNANEAFDKVAHQFALDIDKQSQAIEKNTDETKKNSNEKKQQSKNSQDYITDADVNNILGRGKNVRTTDILDGGGKPIAQRQDYTNPEVGRNTTEHYKVEDDKKDLVRTDITTKHKEFEDNKKKFDQFVTETTDRLAKLSDTNLPTEKVNALVDSFDKLNAQSDKVDTDIFKKQITGAEKYAENLRKIDIETEKLLRDIDKLTQTGYASKDKADKLTLDVLQNSSLKNIDQFKLRTKSLAEETAKMDQAHGEAIKENATFEKDALAMDKAHYMALKTDKERAIALDKVHWQANLENAKRFEIMDKTHYMALKTDRERAIALDKIHWKANEENNKRNVVLDKAHYQALKTDKEREIALDRIHWKANEENKKRDIDLDRDHYNALRTNVEKQIAMEKIHWKANEENKKREEVMDKVHYMALKTDKEKEIALDKIHYKANEENKKREEALDKAHFMALKTDKEKEIALEKIHYKALQENAALDEKRLNKAAQLRRQLVNISSKELTDKSNVIDLARQINTAGTLDDLKKVENQIKRIHDSFKILQGTKQGLTGTAIGTLDLTKQQGDLRNLNNEAFKEQLATILKTNQAFGDLANKKIIYTKLNQETGQWTAAIRINGAEQKTLSGIIDKQNKELRVQQSVVGQLSRDQKGLMEQFKIALERVPLWFGAMTLFYGTTHAAQDMIKTIIQVDTQMTRLKRVMDEGTNFDDMLKSSIVLAKELGQTVDQVNEAFVGFAVQGDFTPKDIVEMSKTAIVAANVSDMTVAESTSNLISAMTQFKIQAEDSIMIIDKLNEVDNNFAVTTKNLSDGISKAGSTAATFGVTLDELVGNITAISVATRESGDEIGNGLKTIYSRLGSDSSLTALKAIGVEVKKQNGENKTASQILTDLSSVWNTLTDTQKQNTAITVAGRFQLSRFLALMNNWNISSAATVTALNSQGSAMHENEKYQDSLQAKINKLTAAWQEFGLAVGDQILTDAFVGSVKALMGVLETMTFLVGKLGVIAPLLTTVALAFFVFNTRIRTDIMAVQGLSGSLGILGAGLRTTKVLAIATGEAFALMGKFMARVTIPLIVISVISTIVEKIITYFTKLSDKQREATTVNYEQVNSLTSLKNGLQEVSTEYQALKAKTDKTEEDKLRMLQIERDLVATYKISSTGINEQGVAYSDNIDLINARTKALQEEIDKQNELNATKLATKESDNTKVIEKETKAIEKRQEKLKIAQGMLTRFEKDVEAGNIITNKNGEYGKKLGHLFNIDPKDEEAIQKFRELLNLQVSKIQTDMDASNVTLQEAIKQRADVLNNEVTQYIRGITERGGKVSDAQRNFVKEFSSIVATNGETLVKQSGLLAGVVNKLKDGSFDDAIAKYKKAREAFDHSDNPKSKKDLIESKDNIQEIVKTITASAATTPQAKLAMEGFVQLFMGQFPTNVISLNNGLNAFVSTSEELTKVVNEAQGELKTLNNVISDVNKENSLSADTVLTLLTMYPQLSSAVRTTADGYTIEKTALEKVRDASLKSAEDRIRTEKGLTTVAIDELNARLLVYGSEITQLATLGAAMDLINTKTQKDLSKSGSFQYVPDYFKPLVIKSKVKEDSGNIEQALKDYYKAQAETEALLAKLRDRNLGVTPDKTTKKAADAAKAEALERKDLTKGFIDSYNEEYNIKLKVIASMERQIKIAEKQKDYAKQIELSNKLLKEQKLAIDDLNSANVKLHARADALRNRKENKKFDTESWFNANGTQSLKFEQFTDSFAARTEKIVNSKMSEAQKKIQIAAIKNELSHVQELFDSLLATKTAYKDNANAIIQMNDAMDANSERIQQMHDDAINTAADAHDKWVQKVEDTVSKVIDAYKQAYEAEKKGALEVQAVKEKAEETSHQATMDRLDAEVKAYEDVANAQINSLDRKGDTEDYNRTLKQKQDEAKKVQDQLDALALDNSIEAQLKKKDLAEQLAKIQDDITNTQGDRDKKLQKEAIQDQVNEYKKGKEKEKDAEDKRHDKAKDNLDNEKKAIEQYYDDLINNDKKWAEVRAQIFAGNFKVIEEDFKNLKDNVTVFAELMGKGLSENVLYNLNEIGKVLQTLSFGGLESLFGNLTGDDWKNKLQQPENSGDLGKVLNPGSNGSNTGSGNDTLARAKSDRGFAIEELGRTANLYSTAYSGDAGKQGQAIDWAKQILIARNGDISIDQIPALAPEMEGSALLELIKTKGSGYVEKAQREISRAAMVYFFKKVTEDTQGAESAHVWAERLRKLIGPSTGQSGQVQQFDTGGFTGSWGEAGKVGILHEKELVLNKIDTSNILKAVDLARNFVSGLTKFNPAAMTNGNSNAGNVFNISLNIKELTGDKQGAEYLISEFVKGVRQRGGNI